MTLEEDQELSLAEYWDGRYANAEAEAEAPTHEWFRSFGHLLPYLERNLLKVAGFTAQDDPRILHLGSGDSVSIT